MTDQKIIKPATATAPANAGVPTAIANPSRASWRVGLTTFISYLILANAILPIASQFLIDNTKSGEIFLGNHYGEVLAFVNGASVLFGLGAKLVHLIVLNPTVNAFIQKHAKFFAAIKPSK